MKNKIRLDMLVVDRGLATSRERARALILAGQVRVNGLPVTKAGTDVPADAEVTVDGPDHPYVSRGGVKLAHAFDHFAITAEGKIALDIGASTGGFTDVLLARGAVGVYAVDVGHGQLAWKLRQDPRVIVHERLNARHLTRAEIPEPIDIVTCDASFIGLATVLAPALALTADEAELVALIKPQFEAGRELVGKGGVVRDAAVQQEVCARVAAWIAAQPRWRDIGVTESPILGPGGNREFLLYARRGGSGSAGR